MPAPSVQVSVSLVPELDGMASDAGLSAALRDAIAIRVTAVMRTLGIPGGAEVQVAAVSGTRKRNLPLELTVNGEACRFSEELAARLWCYLEARAPFSFRAYHFLGLPTDSATRFLAALCEEAVKLQPEVLLGMEQAAAYLAALPAGEPGAADLAALPPDDRESVAAALRDVLSLRVSLADGAAAARTIAAGLAARRSADEIAEDLVEALAPDFIEIRMPRAYLEELTRQSDADGREKFSLMRDGMFYELGMRYPDLRFVVDDSLGSRAFACSINHLLTVPGAGLAPDQVLVNDTPEQLTLLLFLDAKAANEATNPANMHDAAILAAGHARAAEQGGFTVWDSLGYLILVLSGELRAWSWCLLRRGVVSEMLDSLAQAFPDLVNAVREMYTAEQITRALRRLLAEQVSVRNTRRILELLLEYDYIVTDPGKYIVFDDRLPVREEPAPGWRDSPAQIAAFLRGGLKQQLSHQHTRGQNTLRVYLLAPEIEKALAAPEAAASGEDGAGERILDAVREELGGYAAAGGQTAILTVSDTRPALRALIGREFPRLPILAYNELSPDLNIQTLARISFD